MDICLCDHTVDRFLDSLIPGVREAIAALPSGGAPPVVLAIGPSGTHMAERVAAGLNGSGPSPGHHVLEVGQGGRQIANVPGDLRDKDVLVCDGIVNTGSTMGNVRRRVLDEGARSVMTLSLVVRSGSRHIPNFYSITIDKHDDVFFGSSPFPVRGFRDGTIRLLDPASPEDVQLLIETEHTEVYVHGTVADYLMQGVADPCWRTYLIETPEGDPAGLIHFRHADDGTVILETWVVDRKFRTKGYGAALIEFFEGYCRFHRVRRCSLLAIKDKVGRYADMGYQETGRRFALPYGDFVEMELRQF
jgi:GNAT superfamily N-acetyltransferase